MWTLRLGIRLQLLLALGTLLVLAFLPLFFAVASLTRASMTSVRESNARALGRAIAGHVTAARACRNPDELQPLLDAQLGQDGLAAVGIYDGEGTLVSRAGEAAEELPAKSTPGREELLDVQTAQGAALLVVVPGDVRAGQQPGANVPGSVAALVRTDPSTVPSAPLVRLVALYTGIVALALLVFAYFAMTRLVVQPIDRLSHAARRVADGARSLEVSRGGAAELIDLGASLSSMTARLRSDEQALLAKIAEIERYAAELKRAQEQLVRSERLASVGRLSAGLAHEIGNPIAAILGLLQLLLDGGLYEDERQDFLERIQRETERIHGVVRGMLDFARPSVRAGTGAEAEHGHIESAVAEVLALVKPQKAFRNIELQKDLAPDLPRVLLAHERIIQVLLNLLLNAADALRPNGGQVVVRAGLRPDGRVRVEVEDNGPGIAPDVRDKLFEPFVTTKDVGEGTGLGLAVCQGLVEAAGGTISAESAKGGGARIMFDLPAENVQGIA